MMAKAVPKSEVDRVREQIAGVEARLANLDRVIEENDRAVKLAYAREADGSSKDEFISGHPGFEAKRKRRTAVEQKADLEPLLPLLSERLAALEAADARLALEAAASEFPEIHRRLEAAYKRAAELVAEVVTGPWGEVVETWGDYATLRARVMNEGPLAVAYASDPESAKVWDDAAAPRFSPLPATFGQLVELLVLLAIDPGGSQTGHGIRGRFVDLMPDLSGRNVLLRAGAMLDTTPPGGWNIGKTSQILAERQEAVEIRNAPPPSPSPEEVEREAQRVLAVQRLWDLQHGSPSPAALAVAPPPVDLSDEEEAFIAERKAELHAKLGVPGRWADEDAA